MRIGVTDVVAVIVLAAAVARCLRLRHLSRYQHWLIMLGVLLLVSLMLGIASHGVQSSISDSRQYFFFVGAALYMATFRPTADLYDRIGRIWLMAAVLMVLLACVRWLQRFRRDRPRSDGRNQRRGHRDPRPGRAVRVLSGWTADPDGSLLAAARAGAMGPMAGSGTAGRADRARPQDRLVGDLCRRGGAPAARTPAQAACRRARRRRLHRHRPGLRRRRAGTRPKPHPGRLRAPGRSLGGSKAGQTSSPAGQRAR